MRDSLCRFVLSDEPREIERIKEQLSIRLLIRCLYLQIIFHPGFRFFNYLIWFPTFFGGEEEGGM